MRISYSSLETFQNCPAKYKFQVIDKIPAPKSKEAAFGTIIHETLKMLHQPSRLMPPTEEEMLQYFNRQWDAGVYQDDREEAAALYQGVKILKDYYAVNHPSKFNIIDLESFCETPIQDNAEIHIITGKLDRIDKLTDGSLEIIDYKTSKKMPSQKIIDENLQLAVYHLAALNRWPSLKTSSRPIKLSLYFLKHGEKLSVFKSIEQAAETKKKILEIINQIKKRATENNFEARPNPLCDWCDYQRYCPFFKHKFIKQQPAYDKQQIEKLVDEFLTLKINHDKNTKRITEIKEQINEYCESARLERAFGQNGYITRLPQKRFCYDSKLVRQILEPLNKWQEVLNLDKNKLKKIAEGLPPEIRKKLEQAKKLDKEFKILSVKYEPQENIDIKVQNPSALQ